MIIKNWKAHWKSFVNSEEQVTAYDMAQYCIIKALTAKSNKKIEIAQALLRQSFTPVTNEVKLANGRKPYDVFNHYPLRTAFRKPKNIFGKPASMIMDEDGIIAYENLCSQLNLVSMSENEPDYMFIFVRQDLSIEQQAVQAAHAAFKSGCANAGSNPDKTNFVLIGVKDKSGLDLVKLDLEHREIDSHEFIETDLNDETTAIATNPMKEHRKRILKHYKTLVAY